MLFGNSSKHLKIIIKFNKQMLDMWTHVLDKKLYLTAKWGDLAKYLADVKKNLSSLGGEYFNQANLDSFMTLVDSEIRYTASHILEEYKFISNATVNLNDRMLKECRDNPSIKKWINESLAPEQLAESMVIFSQSEQLQFPGAGVARNYDYIKQLLEKYKIPSGTFVEFMQFAIKELEVYQKEIAKNCHNCREDFEKFYVPLIKNLNMFFNNATEIAQFQAAMTKVDAQIKLKVQNEAVWDNVKSKRDSKDDDENNNNNNNIKEQKFETVRRGLS